MKTIYTILVLTLTTLAGRSQSYQLTDLGATIGPNSYAQGINNQGQVVGYWDTTNGSHAFLYQSGTVTDLGLLGLNATNNYALSINNAGQVVGFSETTNGARAFLFQNGSITNLGNFGAAGSYAFGINGNGQIVGHLATGSGARAFLYNNGTTTGLGTLGGTNSFAYGVNNALQVAGSSLKADNLTTHAFLWQNGTLSDLNQLLPYNSGWELMEAHGINDYGNIAGWGSINYQEHAFLYYPGGSAADLGLLTGGTNSYALGLNNSNQVVGASTYASGLHAALWQNGAISDLNDLINASGWDLKEASGINDLGQIVGWGVTGGQVHAFLLTPPKNNNSGKTSQTSSSFAAGSVTPLLSSFTVTITSPLDMDTVVGPTNISIAATATDSSSTVTNVSFYVGTKFLGFDTSSVYRTTWANAPLGVFALTAVARDKLNQTATSSVVIINIGTNLLPIADAHVRDGTNSMNNYGANTVLECLTTITNGNNRDAYFKFDLNGVGTNINTAILNVFGKLSAGGTVGTTVYSVTNTSWDEANITWSNAPAQGVALATNGVSTTTAAWYQFDVSSYAQSQGLAGQNLISLALHDPTNSAKLISINSRENTARQPQLIVAALQPSLTIAITNPVNSAIFPSTSNLTISASVLDADGNVTQVQFFADSKLLGTDTNTPYNVGWSNAPLGSYALTATAMDDQGRFATSGIVNINIGTNLLPIADAHVRDGTNSEINFGTNLVMECLTTSTNGNNRNAYFKFNTGSISNISGAQLQFYSKLIGSGAISSTVYSVTDTSWDETNITWSNAPALVTALITNNVTGTNWNLFDVTSYIQSQNAGGLDVISLALHDPTNSAKLISINTRENSSNNPTLLITVSNTLPTISIISPADNTFLATATTNITISVATSSSRGIGQVQFFQGSTSIGVVTNSPFSLTWSNVTAGIYQLMAVAFDNYGPTATSEVVNVTLDPPPSVALTSPPNNSAFFPGANISVGATASDAIGVVTQVQFFQGTASLGIFTNPPYSLIWSNVTAGTYALTAVAVNNYGLISTSSVVNVAVDLPNIALTNPVNNAFFRTGANIFLGATAADAIGTVTQAQFFQGSTSLGKITNAPFSLIWSNVANGAYPLTARATDNYGLMTTSAVVNITVESPPTVSLTNPANNALFLVGTNLSLVASAADSDGTVAQVQFFQGVTSLGIVTNSPYTLVWTNPPAGAYSLTAQAMDDGGLLTTSSVVNITVDIAPSVSLTSPANNTVIMVGGNIGLTANAADTDGTVTQVQFFQGTTSLGTVTSAPYSLLWTNVGVGSYSLTARARDNNGVISTSSVVSISVTNIVASTNLILWLRADTIVGLTNNAGIGTWYDGSGQTNNATQATTNARSIYVTNVLNRLPVIRFNGTNSYFNLTNFMVGTTGAEEFVVLKVATNPPVANQMLWRLGSTTTTLGYPNASGQIVENFGSSSTYTIGAPTQPLTQYHVYQVAGGPTNWLAWINGQLLSQVPGNTFGTWNSSGYMLGCDIYFGPTRYFAGDLAEVLVFNRPLVDSERLTVNAYLNGKYGLVPAVPAAPTNLVATAVSASQISLTWNEVMNAGATQISVERSTASNGTYTVVAQIPGATSYVDTNLTAGTTYYYRVRAINITQWSAYSGIASATTTATGASLPIESLALWLKADAGLYQGNSNQPVNVWQDQSGKGNNATQTLNASGPTWVPGVIGDRPVIRFNGTNSYFNLPNFLAGAPGAEAFVVLKAATNLPSSSQPLWQIGSADDLGAAGNGAEGGCAHPSLHGTIRDEFGSARFFDMGPPNQAVDQYHLFEATSQSNNWAAWINGILQYQTTNNTVGFTATPYLGHSFEAIPYVSVYNNFFKGDIAEVLVFNRGLTADERFVVNAYLNGKYGLVPAVPAAPTNLVATAVSASQISLTWNEVMNAGATQISVERSTASNGTYTVVAQIPGATSYVDTNLTAGTTYYYQVRAINMTQWSGYSGIAFATTTQGASLPVGSLALWLKADAGLYQGSTNQVINLWQDQGSSGNNAVQSSAANQPLWVPGAIGSRPVIRFNGTNSYFNLPNFLAGATGAEAFVVVKAATNLPSSSQPLWQIGNCGDLGAAGFGVNAGGCAYPGAGGVIWDDFGRTTIASFGQSPQLLTEYHIYEVVSQSNNWAAWINGILQYQTTNNTVGFTTNSSYLAHNFEAIPSVSVFNNFFQGDIAEVLIFNRALIDAERLTVNAYLNAKYGLVPAVPAAPTNLVATAVSASQISLTWNEVMNAGATQISVERSTASNGTYTVVAQIPGATSYVDTNLTAGTTYYYRVRAINITQWSAYSGIASATTTATGASLPIESLALWLKADAGLAQGNTNLPVNLWQDQSGKGNHASQTNGPGQPQWIPAAIGDRPVMRFNGTNSYFVLPSGLMSGATAAEAFVVLKAATNRPVNSSLWQIGSAPAVGSLLGNSYPQSDGTVADDFGSANMQYEGTPVQSLTNYHLYQVSSQPGRFNTWIDGNLFYQTVTNTVGFATGVIGADSLRQGPSLGYFHYFIIYNGGYNGYFKGDIAEVLIFNRPLSASERDTVGNYLLTKYPLTQYATNTTLPSIPTNLTATGTAPYQLNLQWALTSTNTYSFHVERGSGTNGPFQEIGVAPSYSPSFVDTTALPVATNYYRIKAHNLFGDSGYSTIISPPTVSLTNWPVTTMSKTTNMVSAQAASANGTISNVAFYVNRGFIATTSAAPYTVFWSAPMEGSWSLSALATDSLGNSQYSAPVTVTVYRDSNGDGIPDYLQVLQGNDPMNPWVQPTGDTNSTPPDINLLVPADATLLP